jgi:hypothetical protein
MFKCCKKREKRYTFENGTIIVAESLEDALEKVKSLVKDEDRKISWNAYMDLKKFNEMVNQS